MKSIHTSLYLTAITFCFCCCNCLPGLAQTFNYKAYSVFIYNFAKYTEWPTSNTSDNFVITIFGNSEITSELKAMAEKKTINGRQIVIKETEDVEQLLLSHIVFITSEKSRDLQKLKEKTKGAAVLLIAERDGLSKKGAHVSFFATDDNKLRFEVSTQALEEHHLKMSSSLLSLAYKE